ncbi:hypothetical protein C8Q70DRAFT_990097 [Cubamyces menziesii]|nr:hypothetical protein C8Q70DRAFT_990097 [Cubamyces menziesii]
MVNPKSYSSRLRRSCALERAILYPEIIKCTSIVTVTGGYAITDKFISGSYNCLLMYFACAATPFTLSMG